MEYLDLMYFGYPNQPESLKNESDFIAEVKERFPKVELKDAYDSIKGYRQEVYLDKEQSDDYYAWIIAHGWMNCSLLGTLMFMDKTQGEKLKNYVSLAKSQYPSKFKTQVES